MTYQWVDPFTLEVLATGREMPPPRPDVRHTVLVGLGEDLLGAACEYMVEQLAGELVARGFGPAEAHGIAVAWFNSEVEIDREIVNSAFWK